MFHTPLMKMGNFKYQGLTFKPLRGLAKHEDFPYVSKKLRSTGIWNYNHTDYHVKNKVADWNYEEFYKAAIASDPVCEIVDVFVWVERKILVVPCDNELFEYRG